MSDPARSSGPAHHLLDPIAIDELRKRVIERRVAREEREAKMPGKKRAATVPRAAADVDIEIPGAGTAEEITLYQSQPSYLSLEEEQAIRRALAEADREEAELSRANAARAAAPPADDDQRVLLDAVVAWILEDADVDDTFRKAVQERYLAEFAEAPSREPGGTEAALAAAFQASQQAVYAAPPFAHIDYVDTVLRSCPGDGEGACSINWILAPKSLGAFQFHELRKYSK